MPASVLTVLLVIATVMGAGMIVPQVVRLHRSRSVDGLSGHWVGVGIVLNAWWMAYGTSEQLWGLVPVSAGAGVLYLVMAVQYRAIVGPTALRDIIGGMVLPILGPLPFLAVGGWDGAALAIGLAYAVQFAPAVLMSLRTSALDGISATTWAMAWIEAIIWLTYGIVEADPALVIGGIGGSIMAAVILGRVAWDRVRIVTAPDVMGAPAG